MRKVLLLSHGAGAHPGMAFVEFERRRKTDLDVLAELSFENFIEMRDTVGSWAFRAKKEVDAALARALPGVYLPLYNLVTFTRMPYAAARRRARRQDAALAAAAAALGAWTLYELAGLFAP